MTSDTPGCGDGNLTEPASVDASAEPSDAQAVVRTATVVPFAGLLSLGAGAVHAAAAGIHAETPQLARIFVLVAALQIGAGILAIVRPARWSTLGVIGINVGAVLGWLTTRFAGIGWIDGLGTSEAPQFADAACASLGAAAVVVASASLVGWRRARPMHLALPGLAVAALAIPAMLLSVTHVHADGDAHGHDDVAAAAAAGEHDDGHAAAADAELTAAGEPASTDHPHDAADATDLASHADDHAAADHATADDHAADHSAESESAGLASRAWPRPWDPADGIDLADVEGVTPEQQTRAEQLIEESLRELPRWADTSAAIADGYASIGDAGTGTEHYIRGDLIDDDILDPTAPESLVYLVDGDERILAGAMFIASSRPSDDPSLTDFAGALMTWHKHDNLCWDTTPEGKPTIVGLIDAAGNCARGVRAGDAQPMVHVWITPHDCGPFAALEGVGAGTAAVTEEERVDKCGAHTDHGESGDDHAAAGGQAAAPVPYDPALPIDLGGVEGVSPQQQAAAENLVAINVVRLPRWSDYRTAEAAGFRSIGDGGRTGAHEHFIQWDWINDDVILDPDAPESLVYEVQADGSRTLVSAMYMLPDDVALDEVPDIGGPLMQWHIHDNLCFSSDPDQPRVAGITDAAGACSPGLVKLNPAAMIHVWITPHRCGPFAALEGIGAGQVLEGETHLCDHAHGA